MLNEQTLYWIWLARACGVASKSFVRIIERFLEPFDVYSLDENEIEHIEGIGERLKAKLCDKSLEESYSVVSFCKKNKIDIITYGDKKYPSRLRQLEDPPAVLFCKGKLPDFNSRLSLAVVGTRKMSEYGKASAYKIAYEMAAANAIVVSGMALGIDGVASGGAIAAGGETVAVLGCGIDVVYPKQHRELYEKIAKTGAVISEYMPSTSPEKYNFPVRNRIISGLCQGTLVVEGDRRSGALITAKNAIAQGREVFALPGKVDESNSEGPNELIRDGAYVALCSDDIIEHYDFLYHDVINYRGLKKAKARSDSELDGEFLEELGICARSYKKEEFSTEENVSLGEKTKAEEKTTAKVLDTDAPVRETVAEELLAGLDETAKKVFAQMPIDTAVSPDALIVEGCDIGDVITALTMLELCGLVTSLPGGLYVRK
ncbi:MAG: DNA-processing protein DprA [Clostridia bacterium]|nr:DNA-processing protein DprA [Clostridia bacterium]